MPYAIFVYAPREEFLLRDELKAMAGELRRQGIETRHVSLADLGYRAVAKAQAEDGGWDRIYEGERRRKSWKPAVQTVQYALTKGSPLADHVVEEVGGLDARRTLVVLGRVGALIPAYRPNALLAELAGRLSIPTVLLYPGRHTDDGGLRLLDEIPSDASSYARIF